MAKLLARTDVVSLCFLYPSPLATKEPADLKGVSEMSAPHPRADIFLTSPFLLLLYLSSSFTLLLSPLLLLFVPIPQSSLAFREPCPGTSQPSSFLSQRPCIFIDRLTPKPQCSRGEQQGCHWWWFRTSLTVDGCWRQRDISFSVATGRYPGFCISY